MSLTRMPPWVERPLPAGYQLVRQLGSGRRGEVWEAEVGGRRLALKILQYDRASAVPPDLRSILLAKSLQHPNLLKIDGVMTIPNGLLVTMELADFSLADLMSACREERLLRLPAAMVCESLIPVATALDFLNARRHPGHERAVGIQHADVKPSNLLQVGNT